MTNSKRNNLLQIYKMKPYFNASGWCDFQNFENFYMYVSKINK